MVAQQQTIAGRYRLEAIIGMGGMGSVHLAVDLETGESVAVKMLKPSLVAERPDFVQRFLREGDTLRQLDHPNIIKALDAIEEDGRHFLVMEYVAGGSLRDLLQRESFLAVERVLALGIAIGDAIARAHDFEIIHRDLKPENILLAQDGTPRVADFGVALIPQSMLTKIGVALGTVAYMSPEAVNHLPVDTRADIWSFGVLLFELLSGRRPFGSAPATPIVSAILTDAAPNLLELRTDVPPALVTLVERMLEKDRDARIPTMRMAGAELELIAKGIDTPPGPYSTRSVITVTQTARHNLPAQATTFIGREAELRELSALVLKPDVRLVTALGPGGIGKTRLALEMGMRLVEATEGSLGYGAFPGGVYFVDLATLSDAALIPGAIASALRIHQRGDEPQIETLKRALSVRESLLLLLDNFEHLIAGVAVIKDLLAGAPQLKILVTSRAALRLSGEQIYASSPLQLPSAMQATGPAVLAQVEAVELFVRRAQAVNPAFVIDNHNAVHIAEICEQLGGMPLAIELAASRSRLLTPGAILERMGERLRLLSGGARDAPDRQKTLRATLDWSYDLLDQGEKTLFARLAVFRGGCSLEAVEVICSDNLSFDVFDELESLVDKSMAWQVRDDLGEPRVVMLEMLQEYAREHLGASGEADSLRGRHAAYFADLAERGALYLHREGFDYWFKKLEIEHDNLRAALSWALHGGGEAEVGLRLVAALGDFWFDQGYHIEGQRWAEQAFEHLEDAAPALRADLLDAASAFTGSGEAAWETDRKFQREALEISHELGDRRRIARALVFLAFTSFPNLDEYDSALALCYEAIEALRDLDDKSMLAQAFSVVGRLHRERGDYQQATAALEEALAFSHEVGDLRHATMMYGALGIVALLQGDYDQAEEMYKTAVKQVWQLDMKFRLFLGLPLLAQLFQATGKPKRAVKLFSAWQLHQEASGIMVRNRQLGPLTSEGIQAAMAAARAQLGEATFEAAWKEGRKMSLEEAVAFALEEGKFRDDLRSHS